MCVTMRILALAAALLAATGLSCAAADAPADPVAQFIQKELDLDLSRFPFGASKTNFPRLLPAAAGEETSGWRRLETVAAAPSLITPKNLLDLRFDGDRLVELRMMVVGAWTPATNDNVRLLAEFQKLGAKRRKGNPHRFDLETKEWRMSAEGFCSDNAPGLIQFHITPPQRRGPP
jgi:hypothetical protein